MSDEITGGTAAPVVEAQVTETPPVVEATEVNPESPQDPKGEPQDAGTEPADGEKDPQAEKTFTQAELDDILAKKTAKLARQRDQERQKRENIEREVAKASIPRDEGKPDINNFQDAETYAEAVSEWKLGLRDRQEQVAQEHSKAATFESKTADLIADMEEVDGFEKQKWDSLLISKAMALAIVDSEVKAKLAQHLYANPGEAERIYALTPARQAAEIGKLEAKLTTAPQISKAPAPITPISKGNAITTKSPENMTMDEYIAYRKKQGNTRF